MTRADLLAHAVGMLSELANEAGVDLQDDSLGVKSQLDAAVRDLGEDAGNTAAGEALTEYHVLRRLRYAIAARFDPNATGVQRNTSQVFRQIEALLADAASRAGAAGHPVAPPTGAEGAAGGLTLINLPLNWTQPAVTEYEA